MTQLKIILLFRPYLEWRRHSILYWFQYFSGGGASFSFYWDWTFQKMASRSLSETMMRGISCPIVLILLYNNFPNHQSIWINAETNKQTKQRKECTLDRYSMSTGYDRKIPNTHLMIWKWNVVNECQDKCV